MVFPNLYFLMTLLAVSLCFNIPQDSSGIPRGIVRQPITSVAKDSTISKRQIHEAIKDDAAERKFVITSNAVPHPLEKALIILHSRGWSPSPERFCCI
jgi:hypothetical protein